MLLKSLRCLLLCGIIFACICVGEKDMLEKEEILDWLAATGTTQTQLAVALGVNRTHLSLCLSGRRPISQRISQQISSYMAAPGPLFRARKRHGNPYTTSGYSHWVTKAVIRYNKKAPKKAQIEPWHPNQIRHSFGTRVRASHGPEAAQVLLGHSSTRATDIYALRDAELAKRVVAKHG